MTTDREPLQLWEGEGFSVIPWAKYIRDGEIGRFDDGTLEVLPVIVSHCIESDSCYPSMNRIAALAGASKTTVSKAIAWLEKNKWIKIDRETMRNGRIKHTYTLAYNRAKLKSTHCTAISNKTIRNGVWGALPPSAKKLYLVLKSFSYPGGYAHEGGAIFSPYREDGITDWDCDFDFVPRSTLENMGYELPHITILCGGIPERTYRDARGKLTRWGLIEYYEGNYYDGLSLPHDCGHHAPKVLQRAAVKGSSPQARARAKRLMTAVHRQSGKSCPDRMSCPVGGEPTIFAGMRTFEEIEAEKNVSHPPF